MNVKNGSLKIFSTPRSMAMSAVDKKREMLRTLARKDILWFGQYMQPKFKMYAHQKLIAEKLKRIVEYIETRGQSGCGRLMVLMPPQHGKSTISANLFPAWALGNHPDWRFVMVSYNAKRAERNSKAVRDLVDSVMFSPLFGLGSGQEHPVELSSDNRGVSSWSLAQPNTGGMISAGVGGSITGYDAQVIIVDDPFAGREDAESAAEREKVIDWYESQVYSRQQDGTAIILFHTRWHQADLAGHLISSMANNPKADQWEIICLPALAFEDNEYPRDVEAQARLMLDGVYLPLADPLKRLPGAALCPEMTRLELLENIRENMNAYNWMSLYQQMPFLRSGGKFKRAWFKIAEKLPDDVRFVRAVWYWDQAAKSGDGDYSAGVLMAMEYSPSPKSPVLGYLGEGRDGGRIWVLQVVRGQFSTFERRQEMRRAYEAARLRFGSRLPAAQLWHPQDPASAGLDSARDTNKALAGLPAHFEPVSGDKETRADPWSSALESDNVILLKGGWNQPFIEEHLSFPKGRNDDQVDAAASAYTKLNSAMGTTRMAVA
jgi:predicted phage terminase large subunit-like protein